MVLDYHGYTELKIKKENVGPSIRHKLAFDNPYYKHTDFAYDLTSTTRRKFYALYTGKEEEEDKEMIRNIFNGSLDKLPPSLRDDIVDRFYHGNYDKVGGTNKNNMYGELIQLLIISSSGAEGIDLKNVRFVHIMEPYWHPVRIEQVVGRARRICSHKDLPLKFESDQTNIILQPGQVQTINYSVENLGSKSVSAMATFQVYPPELKDFMTKMNCFCYEKQTLKAGAKEKYALVLLVDPNVTKNIKEAIIQFVYFKK